MSEDNQESPMSEASRQEQIVDLQTRLSFQEDALQAMSQQMADQAEQLRIAQRHIRILNEKLNDLSLSTDQAKMIGAEPKPPHY